LPVPSSPCRMTFLSVWESVSLALCWSCK
jgi:hypothetical protein